MLRLVGTPEARFLYQRHVIVRLVHQRRISCTNDESQYIRKAFSLYYARLILKGAIQTNQNIFSKNRVSLKSVADTEAACENHGAEGAFYYAIDGFVGDLIAKRKYLVGWKQF